MRPRATIACLALLAAVPFHATAQSALPALFSDAIGESTSCQQPMSYDVSIEQKDNALSYTVNPGATGASRVTAVSPPENKLDQGERMFIQRARSDIRDIWCASHYLSGVTDVELVREDEMSTVYSFVPSAGQLGGSQSAPMLKYIRGEVTVLKAGADVSEVQMSTVHPFGASIMHIEKFSISVRCEQAENGRRFATETATEFAGSALFKHFDVRTVEHISNLRLAN